MRRAMLFVLAACGYDYDSVAPPLGQFVATPTLAGVDDTIVLEGRSGDDFAAYLQGMSGRIQPATEFLGSQRLAFSVPGNAVSGALELRITDFMFPGPRVKLTSFQPRLGSFVAVPYQWDAARLPPSLLRARRGATPIVAGEFLYVIGGMTGETAPLTMLGDIERARINADGTLGTFEVAGTVTPRANAAAIAIGDWLYLTGGEANGYLASIERAPLTADGLGNFEALAATLRHPRADHRLVVLGDRLIVAGGRDMAGPVAAFEQAAILGATGLAAPADLEGIALATPRAGFAAIVTRSGLYIAGGETSTGLADAETISVSGEAEFEPPRTATGVTLAPRVGAASLFIGHRAYIAGGRGSTTIEEATIDSEGNLGDFVTTGSSSTEREGAALVVGRNHAFLAGGKLLADLTSIETASIAAGCTVDPFANEGDLLTTARASAAYVALGPRLCAIGGDGTAGPLASIECATVDDNGNLGAFEQLPVQLGTARSAPAIAVIDTWLYVIGGNDGSSQLATIERAPIATDGTLGAFVPAGMLVTGRSSARAIILGRQLHVLGGWLGGTTLTSFESATIAADGSLGTFATGNFQVPPVRAGAVGVVGPSVWMIGETKFRRASITNDRFSSFSDVSGTLFDGRVVAAVVGDQLFLTGGDWSPSRIYAVSMSAAGIDTSPTQVATLDTPRLDAGMIVLGDWLYVLGGRSPTSAMIFNTIERAQLR